MVADFPKNISVAEEYFGTLLITIFGMAKDCGARAHYRKTHENVWKCGIRTSIYINSLPEKVCDFFEKPDKIPSFSMFQLFFRNSFWWDFPTQLSRFLCFHHRTPWSSLFWWWSSALGFSLAAVFFSPIPRGWTTHLLEQTYFCVRHLEMIETKD